jgi:hypothetical protein
MPFFDKRTHITAHLFDHAISHRPHVLGALSVSTANDAVASDTVTFTICFATRTTDNFVLADYILIEPAT